MTAQLRAIALNIPADVQVCIPPTLDTMTTYCILEQDDWFEKEITFVRRLLQPGMTVIDIGANYGVYSLAAARAVGPQGAVWAFEPASAVLPYLRESIARNRFTQIRVVDAALAHEEGIGHLHLARDPALNQLQAPDSESGSGESVGITTLDHQQATLGWGEVDFIKLDAEGAERRILRGGRDFLAQGSPLVMFERLHNGAVDDAIAADFRYMGWGIYRLTSPQGYLVPLEPGQAADPFELNLFACKQACAARLAGRGLLVVDGAADVEISRGGGIALLQRQAFWPALAPRVAGESPPLYMDTLDAFAAGLDGNRPLEQRWAALRRAVGLAKGFARQPVIPAMCSTLARIAFEAGEHQLMMEALQAIIQAYPNRDAPVRLPLWPAAPRYDTIGPGADPVTWFHAAVIEQFERVRTYSSLFGGPGTLPLLDWLQSTRFAGHEMERRRVLMRLTHHLEAKRTPLLDEDKEHCLNREAWLPSGAVGSVLIG